MKKFFIVTVTLLSGAMLMAGGNASTKVAPTEDPGTCHSGGVYVDKIADLMWQDAPYTDTEDGAYKRERSVGKVGTYAYAKSYCAKLDYAGHKDWRLPTSNELIEVFKKEGQVFTYHRGNPFWSSTPTTRDRYEVVFPADAYPYMRKLNSANYIRCVRCLKK